MIHKNIVYNIRSINKRICDYYLKPSLYYRSVIELNFKSRFSLSMNDKHYTVHLRIGDVDKDPFRNYINKSELEKIVISLRKYKQKIILLSDSLSTKKYVKKIIGNNIYTDFKLPCHSRNTKCLNQSMDDIMMMKYSDFLILTRGSTFSLFGSYFSNCKYRNIIYVGHNYNHKNYYS